MTLLSKVQGKTLKQHPFDLHKDLAAGFHLQHQQASPYFGLGSTTAPSLAFYGPRTCECLRALLTLLRIRTSSYVFLCVATDDLQAFLQQPSAASWRLLRWPQQELLPLPDCTAPESRFSQRVKREHEVHGPSWDDLARQHIAGVALLSDCPNRCGDIGWCMRPPAQVPNRLGSDATAVDAMTSASGPEGPRPAARCVCFDDLGKSDAGSCTPQPSAFSCPSACSAHGKCVDGFCQCDEGYFGADCGLSNTQQASGVNGAKVYIYDLPIHFSTSFQMLNLFAGAAFRTADPNAADYFLVPISHKVGQAFFLGLVSYLAEELPYWNASIASGRANQIIGHMQDHGYSTAWWTQPLLLSDVDKFPHHSHPQDPARPLAALVTHLKVDGRDAGEASCRVCMLRGKDVVMPPLPRLIDGALKGYSAADLKAGSPWAAADWRKWYSKKKRSILAFFAGGRYPYYTKGDDPSLRIALLDAWGTSDAAGKMSILDGKRSKYPMHKGMAKSIFCIVPFGTWGGYGGRYTSAILFGCIPVFLHHVNTTTPLLHALERPPLNFPFAEHPRWKWHECALIFSIAWISELQHVLEGVSEDHIKVMRQCMQGVWEGLLYSAVLKSRVLTESMRQDAVQMLHDVLSQRLLASPASHGGAHSSTPA